MIEAEAAETLWRAEELVLTTTGRRTGRPHRVTLWFVYDGSAIWLRTDAVTDWYKNLERDARCRVAAAGVELEAQRVAVQDEPDALRRLVDLLRAKYGAEWVADWYVERGRIPVRLRVDAAASPSSSPRTG